MITLDEMIDNGIAVLDEKVPDWRDRINIDHLDMGEPKRCILAQLFGEFSVGCSEVLPDVSWNEVYKYGFDTTLRCDYSYTFEQLTEAWKKRLS